MNGHEHFGEAERLASLALQSAADGEPRLPYQVRQSYLSAAQVHATLSQAHAEGALVGRISRLIILLEQNLSEDEPFTAPAAAHPASGALADTCMCRHLQAAHVDGTGTCLAMCGCEVYRRLLIRTPTQPASVMSLWSPVSSPS